MKPFLNLTKEKKIFPTLLNCFFKKNKFYLKNKNLELKRCARRQCKQIFTKNSKNKSNTNKNIVLKTIKNTNVLKLLKNLKPKIIFQNQIRD